MISWSHMPYQQNVHQIQSSTHIKFYRLIASAAKIYCFLYSNNDLKIVLLFGVYRFFRYLTKKFMKR